MTRGTNVADPCFRTSSASSTVLPSSPLYLRNNTAPAPTPNVGSLRGEATVPT